jgi:hypothetical protein
MENKLNYQINASANRMTWSAPGLPLRGETQADFWRLHLDDGYHKEMMVKSSQQSGSVQVLGKETRIRYDGVCSTEGTCFRIGLTLHILDRNDTLECRADVENQEDVRINEVQFPFIDLSVLCDEDRESDVLYRPLGIGERVRNPWKALDGGHTEYMAADYNEIWSPMLYPRPASMAWFGVESGGHFLYLGRHDEEFRLCSLLCGINPRNTAPRMITGMAHYPFAKKGEKIS